MSCRFVENFVLLLVVKEIIIVWKLSACRLFGDLLFIRRALTWLIGGGCRYVLLCDCILSASVTSDSQQHFADDFLSPLLSLHADRVANVRISLARTLAKHSVLFGKYTLRFCCGDHLENTSRFCIVSGFVKALLMFEFFHCRKSVSFTMIRV